MYNRSFFQTKLGQAAIASIAAMTTFVALSSQLHADPVLVSPATQHVAMIEIA